MITRCPRPVSCISWIKEWELIRSGLAEQAFGISLVTRVGGFHADLVVRFLTPKSWTDLGGSKQAAEYLGDVDEEGVQGKEKNQSKIPHSWRSSTVVAFDFNVFCVSFGSFFLCVLCWHQTWNDFFRCCSPVAGDGLNLTMLCLVNFSEPISQNLKFHNMLNRPWSQVKVKSAWSVCRSFFPCCKPIRKKTWCWFSFLLRLQVC